jgi:hypothetical protein
MRKQHLAALMVALAASSQCSAVIIASFLNAERVFEKSFRNPFSLRKRVS